MKRIFSGIQPTGNLHLGNYLGAIQNWVKLQKDYECLFCIVDLHAITVPQDPAALRAAIRQTAAAYIASGIDPKHSIIFQQSAVSGHSELGWLLSCLTPLGWLNRMTQFKEKSKQSLQGIERLVKEAKNVLKELRHDQKYIKSEIISNTTVNTPNKLLPDKYVAHTQLDADSLIHGLKILDIETEVLEHVIQQVTQDLNNSSKACLGLYAYPVLMAADILLYHATHVPVGEDQKQHLELARDIAGAFNRQYNTEYFKLPEPQILGQATRVMSLRDGTKKMSKSDASAQSRIHLNDSDDDIRSKIQKAQSDAEIGITYDLEKRPAASNLLTIMAAVQGKPRAEIEKMYATSNFSQFKKDLADALIAHVGPIRDEMVKLLGDPKYLDTLLTENAQKASAIAKGNIAEIQKLIGLC